MQFVTEAYTLLCALKFCGTSSLNDIPDSFPAKGTAEEQLQWVKSVAQQVVDYIYQEPDKSSVQVAAEAYKNEASEGTDDALGYCLCKSGRHVHQYQYLFFCTFN